MHGYAKQAFNRFKRIYLVEKTVFLLGEMGSTQIQQRAVYILQSRNSQFKYSYTTDGHCDSMLVTSVYISGRYLLRTLIKIYF